MKADTFCEATAQAAITLAASIGTLKVSSRSTRGNCTFGNDQIQAACLASGQIIGKVTEGGLDIGSTTGSVTIAANTIIVDQDGGGKLAANNLAKAMALSLLNCYWSNDQQTTSCPSGVATGSKPGIVPARLIQSYDSKENANAVAKSMADSLANCFWTNKTTTNTCAAGVGKTANSRDGVVPSGTVFSYESQANVDDVAKNLAIGTTFCQYGNSAASATIDCPKGGTATGNAAAGIIFAQTQEGADAAGRALAGAFAGAACSSGADGAPGANGAQTNCQGNCFGYFS